MFRSPQEGYRDAGTDVDGQAHPVDEQRVAIITGGSRGIGFAAALGLGGLGMTVYLLGRTGDHANAAARVLRSRGIDAHADACDVSQAEEAAAVAERLPSPDVVVASAGVMAERMTKTLRTSPEEWRRVQIGRAHV